MSSPEKTATQKQQQHDIAAFVSLVEIQNILLTHTNKDFTFCIDLNTWGKILPSLSGGKKIIERNCLRWQQGNQKKAPCTALSPAFSILCREIRGAVRFPSDPSALRGLVTCSAPQARTQHTLQQLYCRFTTDETEKVNISSFPREDKTFHAINGVRKNLIFNIPKPWSLFNLV